VVKAGSGLKVTPAVKVLPDHKAVKDQLAHKAIQVSLVVLARKAQPVIKVL
jgi:hypothetical protein